MISASHRIPPLLQSDGSFAISNVEKCELMVLEDISDNQKYK